MTARRPPRYPGLPTPDAFTGEQRAYLERLQELLQNTTGLKGDPKERVPTIRELEAVGVIKTTVKNSQAEIRPGDGLQSTIQGVHVPRVRWQDIIGKPDLCCDPIEWGDIVDIPENIKQLAALDCCGIIVRQCETNPVFGFDTAYAPAKIADVEVWTEGGVTWEQKGTARQGDVIKEVSAEFRTGRNVDNQLIGDNPFFPWRSRTFDPVTGLELTTGGGMAELAFNSNAWAFVPKTSSGSIYALVAQAAGDAVGVSRWYVDGTMGPAPRSFYPVSGFHEGYHCVFSGFGIYVPGYGIYNSGRGETAISRAIHFWPAATPTTMPPANASAGMLYDTGIPAGTIYLYDYDDDGNIYGIADTPEAGVYRVFCLSPAPSITVLWSFDLPTQLVPGLTMNLLTMRIAGQGTILLYQATGVGGDRSLVFAFDISSQTEAVPLGQFDTGTGEVTALQNSKRLSPCEIMVGDSTEIWEVCAGEFVVDPGESAQWLCREIVAAGSVESPPRLTVANGDGQGGDITLDLTTVEQGVGGELRARTVDSWGRVVENRAVVADDIPELPISKTTGLQAELDGKEPSLGNPAEDGYVLSSLADGTRSWVVPPTGGGGSGGVLPLVTGEVPPVLVYLDNGSLVYSGVE